MKSAFLICGLSTAVVLGAGCSTERGATSDQYYSNPNMEESGVTGSPTMRPGMDTSDPRDPTYLSHHTPSSRTP